MSLYTPYKAVGIVTDGKPFAVNQLGTETFLTVTIGSVFQVYRTDKLTVSLVGRQTPGAVNIAALAVCDKETFCAAGNKIFVYNRQRLVRTYVEHDQPILGLCMVGRTLVSWDESGSIRIIDTQKRSVVSEMQTLENSKISAVAHPATYINKFVFGYENGNLELWNIRKCKLVHRFDKLLNSPAVTALEQSPAVDVFGIGFNDGTILMVNLKLDKVLFAFKQQGGAVTTLSFRTDPTAADYPFMVSGGSDGRLHVWNLAKAKLQNTMEEAHRAAICSAHFLHGEPVLVTSAADNTIKMWIFDAPDGSARLLRSREGHIGHSNKIRYYGGDTAISMRENTTAESCEIISAGSDGTLRLFNTAIESQNREISQKPILRKLGLLRRNERLPIIEDFSFSETRQRDWGNLVTIHAHHANAYVWRYKHRRMGSSDRQHHSTAVTVTPCGNFALIGSRGGVIYKYNLQSGLPQNTAEMAKKTFPERHSGEIRGLFVDTSNSVLVSCALDGNTIFWDLNKGSVLNCVESDTAHLLMVGMRDAGFAAVASQDRVIRVYDMTTYKLARRFDGHSREVSDLAFTPDACRLLSASADSTVRVWDMPTGRCLTWLRFGAPVLSLAVALSGESLSITQAGKDGIYTYVDRSLYEAVMFWKEPDAPIDVVDSEVVSTNAADESTGDEDLEEFESAPSQETVEQRAPGAITMSALPRGYWSTLFHLEAVKARNKPKAAPEKPKSAPFFLPTIFRGGAKRATTEESKKSSHKKKKRNSSQAANAPDDEDEDEDAVMAELAGMGSAWNDEDDEDDEERWSATSGTPSAAIDQPKPSSRISADADSVISISATLEYLKTLPPPAIDVEFRALCTHGEDEEGLKLLHCLLSWLAQRIASSLDFEVLEAYLHRTLLIYGEIIVTKPSLLAMTQEISRVHSAASMKLRDLVQGNLCLLKLLADLPPLQA
eukprot:GSChrysophyteH1.ASY1.ANO1.2966.1 assembled CDS